MHGSITKKISMMLAIANGINYFHVPFQRIKKESYKKVAQTFSFWSRKELVFKRGKKQLYHVGGIFKLIFFLGPQIINRVSGEKLCISTIFHLHLKSSTVGLKPFRKNEHLLQAVAFPKPLSGPSWVQLIKGDPKIWAHECQKGPLETLFIWLDMISLQIKFNIIIKNST